MVTYRTAEDGRQFAHVVIVGKSRLWGGYADRVVGVHATEEGALDWCFHHMKRTEPGDWTEQANATMPPSFNGRVWCGYGRRIGYETLEIKT